MRNHLGRVSRCVLHKSHLQTSSWIFTSLLPTGPGLKRSWERDKFKACSNRCSREAKACCSCSKPVWCISAWFKSSWGSPWVKLAEDWDTSAWRVAKTLQHCSIWTKIEVKITFYSLFFQSFPSSATSGKLQVQKLTLVVISRHSSPLCSECAISRPTPRRSDTHRLQRAPSSPSLPTPQLCMGHPAVSSSILPARTWRSSISTFHAKMKKTVF